MKKEKFSIMAYAHAGMLTLKASTLHVMYENNQVFLNSHLKDEIESHILEIKKLEGEYDPETIEIFYEDIGDYEHFSKESSLILSHFMMVALYSYYEITLKNILKLTKKLNSDEIRSLYLFRRVKEILRDKFSIIYDDRTNTNFLLIDELRLINNCIKHGGFVDDELHNLNPEWVVGEEFGDLCAHFIKFEHIPSSYLKEIISKISDTL